MTSTMFGKKVFELIVVSSDDENESALACLAEEPQNVPSVSVHVSSLLKDLSSASVVQKENRGKPNILSKFVGKEKAQSKNVSLFSAHAPSSSTDSSSSVSIIKKENKEKHFVLQPATNPSDEIKSDNPKSESDNVKKKSDNAIGESNTSASVTKQKSFERYCEVLGLFPKKSVVEGVLQDSTSATVDKFLDANGTKTTEGRSPMSSPAQSPHVYSSFAESCSSLSEGEKIKPRSVSFKSTSRKRKANDHPSESRRQKLKLERGQPLPHIEDSSSQSIASFRAVNGTGKEESVGSPMIVDEEWKEHLNNFTDILQVLCFKVTDRVVPVPLSEIENNAQKCPISYLKSLTFKNLMEDGAKEISDHIDAIRTCVLNVAGQVKKQACDLSMLSNYTSDNHIIAKLDTSVKKKMSIPLPPSSDSSCSFQSLTNIPYNVTEASTSQTTVQLPIQATDSVVMETTEEAEEDPARAKRILKYEKLLEVLSRRIEKLREKEETDDEDNSVYLRQDRLERKFNSIWKMLCKEYNQPTHTGRPVQKKIPYKGTRYPEINSAVVKLLNKEKIFPDFRDVLELVESTNGDRHLGIMNTDALARQIFAEIGNVLKQRRVDDHLLHLDELIKGDYQDPAEDNEELSLQLHQSEIDREARIQEVIDSFVHMPETQQVDEKSDSEKEKSESENEKENSDFEKSDDEEQADADADCLTIMDDSSNSEF